MFCNTSIEYYQDLSLKWLIACVSKNGVFKGGGIVCSQLGVWFPHYKSHVTLIYFLDILSTYVYIFFQLRVCKYLDNSVTHVYILSSNWAVVEGILPCPFFWCWLCIKSTVFSSQSSTRIHAEDSCCYHPCSLLKPHSAPRFLLWPSLLCYFSVSHAEFGWNQEVGLTKCSKNLTSYNIKISM